MKLDQNFYRQKDVVKIASELIGKFLFTRVNNTITSGKIVETEAYSWKERGCHAFGAKLTGRTSVMFEEGGRSYVYLCYGMHNLFNIVTNVKGVAEAVLIRALEPSEGIDVMQSRRGSTIALRHLTSGPGKLTKSMGIDRTWNGKVLTESEIWVEDAGTVPAKLIEVSKRIGIDYAGDDAKLPWRFSFKGNPWVSKV